MGDAEGKIKNKTNILDLLIFRPKIIIDALIMQC